MSIRPLTPCTKLREHPGLVPVHQTHHTHKHTYIGVVLQSDLLFLSPVYPK